MAVELVGSKPRVEVSEFPGDDLFSPRATPTSVAIPIQGGLEARIYGGFSKLEDASLRVAAGMIAIKPGGWGFEELPVLAECCVNAAIAILRECEKRTEKEVNGHEQ